jgi:hypothetical protein
VNQLGEPGTFWLNVIELIILRRVLLANRNAEDKFRAQMKDEKVGARAPQNLLPVEQNARNTCEA